jgi:hypothetical protein
VDSKSAPFSLQFRKAIQLPIFCAVLILAFAASSFGQGRPDHRDSDDRSGGGISAGGNWMQYRSEDRMTAEKLSRFELQANANDSQANDSRDNDSRDNDSRDGDDRNGDGRAQVVLYCSDGKLKLADFRPNLRLSRPNWGGFWGQPQMRVRVRVDDSHDDHSWNWVNGHFLSMDKGTTRQLIGAHVFRIEFRTPDGPSIAEFSPGGLDLKLVNDACGLTPKRP